MLESFTNHPKVNELWRHSATKGHNNHFYLQPKITKSKCMLSNCHGVMKMGNIVPRAGIEPTFPAFWSSVLIITSPMLPAITMLPTPTCIWLSYEVTHPPKIVSLLLLTITYRQLLYIYINTQCRFNNHTSCSLCKILVTVPVLWGWWKWETLPL